MRSIYIMIMYDILNYLNYVSQEFLDSLHPLTPYSVGTIHDDGEWLIPEQSPEYGRVVVKVGLGYVVISIVETTIVWPN